MKAILAKQSSMMLFMKKKEPRDTQEATQGVPYKFAHLLYSYKRQDNITKDKMKA